LAEALDEPSPQSLSNRWRVTLAAPAAGLVRDMKRVSLTSMMVESSGMLPAMSKAKRLRRARLLWLVPAKR
jgi:hypothetical protein